MTLREQLKDLPQSIQNELMNDDEFVNYVTGLPDINLEKEPYFMKNSYSDSGLKLDYIEIDSVVYLYIINLFQFKNNFERMLDTEIGSIADKSWFYDYFNINELIKDVFDQLENKSTNVNNLFDFLPEFKDYKKHVDKYCVVFYQ